MSRISTNKFYKGLPGFTRASDDITARDAEDSVYYWWWSFMRLSPVFWFARTSGYPIQDQAMARVYDLAGDLSHDKWGQWWRESGKYAFAEAKRPARVERLNVDTLHEHVFKMDEEAIYLEVPLRIRQQTILKQFKEILARAHSGRELNIAKTSVAPLKLYTKRYSMLALEREFWILVYRLVNDQITVARIGDRLQIAPAIDMRNQAIEVIKHKTARPEHKLMSVTARYLMKARNTMLNAELGSFPNYNKQATHEQSLPFGESHHEEFMNATCTDQGVESPYRQYVRTEFERDLQIMVKKANRLGEKMRLPGSKFREQFPDFYMGKSDKLGI
jgi:hypothetical protein